VGVVFGGRSVEHRVSIVSARTVAAALERAGHAVVPLLVAQDGSWQAEEVGAAALAGELDACPGEGGAPRASCGVLLAAEIDVAFPITHGTWGEDGTLQGLFEMLDLPYVGAGVTASAVAMDKHLAKSVLQRAGVPVVEWAEVESAADLDAEAVLPGVEPPFFVKPSVGGSSVGVERVETRRDLPGAVERALAFDDRVLVERGIVGRELECSVLGYRRLEASRVGEIIPGHTFYDYYDKYIDDTAGLSVPAELEPELEARLRATAVAAFAALGGHGMARVDFLLERGERIYVNEINTLPGFTSISMYPKLWAATGVPIEALVDRLVAIALERHRDRHRLDAGIKDFLASLER
jgi:D-alanine-D-alanine ligase